MSELLMAEFSAAWLGILTSISPCPLATNIVAVSYTARRIERPWEVFAIGVAYSLGRAFVYLALALLIAASLLSIPDASFYLALYMNRALGPLLILVGLVLLNVWKLPGFGGGAFAQRLGEKTERYGIAGAALLGAVFALSFCPVSAALYFGSLIPLAVTTGSRVMVPSLYGIGTALPVLGFSLLLAVGFKAMGRVFERLRRVEVYARRITAAVFVAVGVYYTLKFTVEAIA